VAFDKFSRPLVDVTTIRRVTTSLLDNLDCRFVKLQARWDQARRMIPAGLGAGRQSSNVSASSQPPREVQ
jgi:hypothetical protein